MEVTLPSGPNPFVLRINLASGDSVGIDLDESGWMRTYADYMRVRSIWVLIAKSGAFPPLVMFVEDGDQPYYTARHVGMAGAAGSNETVAYGIGKKLPDGSMVRLWMFDDGVVVGGDDAEEWGKMQVMRMGPR